VTTATEIKIPTLDAVPEYAAAVANFNRLKLEVERLEKARQDLHSIAAADRADKDNAARRVLAGENPADVRRRPLESEFAKIEQDLKLARRAVELASEDVRRVAVVAKKDLMTAYFPAYREKVRAAALSLVATAKAMTELDTVNRALDSEGLYGHGGCASALPAFTLGDPADETSWLSDILGQLIAAGHLDAKGDASALAGCRPRIPAPPRPTPPAVPAKSKRTWRDTMKGLGFAMPRGVTPVESVG
jgi:hypothetical protein